MRLQKTLKIESIAFLSENKYVLEAGYPTSRLKFNDATLETFGVNLDRAYVEGELRVYLEEGKYINPLAANELMISEIGHYVHRLYGPKEIPVISSSEYIARVSSWKTEQFPSFDLILSLTENEYQEMIKLPSDAIMILKKLEIQ